MLHNLLRLCTFRRLVHNRYCVTTGAPGQTPGIMYRFFSLEDDVFSMQTQIDSEFGPVVLWTYANLHVPEIVQRCSQDQTECISLDIRIQEMKFFLNLFKLFDPDVNKPFKALKDEEIVSQTPSQPWPEKP